MSKKAILLLVWIAFLAIMVVFAACEPWLQVKITNNTSQILEIYIDVSPRGGTIFIGEVAPGMTLETKRTGIAAIFPEYRLIAKNQQGEVVYDQLFSSKEFYKTITEFTVTTPK